MKIDETKLTAFVLGEIIDPDLCQTIEEAILNDPLIQKRAEEISLLETSLRTAFQEETYQPLNSPSFPLKFPDLKAQEDESTPVRWLPWISGLAAALCIVASLVIFGYHFPQPGNSESVRHEPVSLNWTEEDLNDLAVMQTENLLGTSASWSDSLVLANSIFLAENDDLLFQPISTHSAASAPLVTEGMPDRRFTDTWAEPLSDIPILYDGLGLTKLELYLSHGDLPTPKEVQIDALVNGFDYNYSSPTNRKEPFAVQVEQAVSPWTIGHTLLRVGVQGYEIPWENRTNSNLVFLVDVSGSMDEANKLPLVKAGIERMIDQLRPNDQIAIVTYGGTSKVILQSTSVSNKAEILETVSKLKPGGSSKARVGIQEAYTIAAEAFLQEGDNRIIVCTDGDLALGTTDPLQLGKLVKKKAEEGIRLSAFGFSVGPQRHLRMEALAALGGGKFGYIDSPIDVIRAFSGKVSGALRPIARNVRFEVEFNPQRVDSYRLIGYEDFPETELVVANNRPSEIEVHSGHSVTALYELIPHELTRDPKSDAIEIASTIDHSGAEEIEELVTVRVHYLPEGRTQAELIEVLFSEEALSFEDSSTDLRFAAAVTGFGQILRNSPYKGDVDFSWVLSTAGNALGSDKGGTRTQFLEMVRQAEAITKPDYSASEN
jgi:Ca-activated chloride channel family protein